MGVQCCPKSWRVEKLAECILSQLLTVMPGQDPKWALGAGLGCPSHFLWTRWDGLFASSLQEKLVVENLLGHQMNK